MRKFLPLFLLLSLSACASLPQATVDMSMMLDKQLQALEQQHLKLIDKYFEAKRKQALEFLDDEWSSNYLNRFFSDQGAEEIWNEMINEPDLTKRISDLQGLISIIQIEYMAQRDSMLLPLERDKTELLLKIREEYATAKTMSNAVLNNVVSVRDIQEKRKEMLSSIVDVDSIEQKMNTYFERADKILDEAPKGIDKYDELEPKVKSIVEKLNL